MLAEWSLSDHVRDNGALRVLERANLPMSWIVSTVRALERATEMVVIMFRVIELVPVISLINRYQISPWPDNYFARIHCRSRRFRKIDMLRGTPETERDVRSFSNL